MYPVSDAYIAARRARNREERITGAIKLKDGTHIIVDDSIIIQGSLSISKKVCSSGKWDVGTMNYSQISMKIIDDEAYDHEFAGAAIKLTYGIVTAIDDEGNKTWEEVPLPPFWVDGVDGNGISRTRNIVSLTGTDSISKLDIDYPDTIPTTSLYAAFQYVCARANVGVAITEDEFNQLPNSGIIPDFSSGNIQSCRDAAMWIAQTVNCSGFVEHRGLINLRQYKFNGSTDYDRLFTADERVNIEYSDTRTYLAYLQSYAGGKAKTYSKVSTWTGSDVSHIKEGAVSLPENPIISKLTAEEQSEVNKSYLENRSKPTRYIKSDMWVDPALELLDVVAFTGGSIDIGKIISVVTQIKWKYRGVGTIYCANITERAETAGETSTAAVMALTDEEDTSDSVQRMEPKTQIEKRLDKIEAKISDGVGKSETAENLKSFDTDCRVYTHSAGIGFQSASGDHLGGLYLGEGDGLTLTSVKGYPIIKLKSNLASVEIYIDYISIRSTKATIYADGDVFSIDNGKQRLEAKTDSDGTQSLYFNGKKVLTE